MNLLTEILCVRLQPDIASVSYVFDFHCPNYTQDNLLKCNEHGFGSEVCFCPAWSTGSIWLHWEVDQKTCFELSLKQKLTETWWQSPEKVKLTINQN